MHLYCGCWSIPIGNRRRIIEHIYICFPWEKKCFKTTYKNEGWQWKRRQTYSLGHESDGYYLKTPTTVKKDGGRWRGGCSICWTAKDRRIVWKCCQPSEWVARTTLSRKINKIWQLPGTIIIQTYFFHISVLNYIFLSTIILCFSLYKIAWEI